MTTMVAARMRELSKGTAQPAEAGGRTGWMSPSHPTAAVRALQRTVGNHAVAAHLGAARGPRRLQRMPIEQARAQVKAEHEYQEATTLLETKLGPYLSGRTEVHAIADKLLARLAKAVNAWADHTGQNREDVYASLFAFAEGQKYYGSFAITGPNVKRVFDNPSGCPLRTKLNLAYYAARSSNFAKLLEAAALEHAAGGATDIDVDEVVNEGKQPARAVQIKQGFAVASGFADIWTEQSLQTSHGPGELTPKQIKDIVDKRGGSKPLLGQKSDAMSAQDPVVKSRADKTYDKAVGLEWSEQPTLRREDVPDITEQELELLYIGKHQKAPTALELIDKRSNWAKKKDKQVRWEMGVASIEVRPGTGSRKEAEAVRGRLDAGISGSTDLMMHLGIHLGLSTEADRKALRLALVAWMISNRDHSLYEIMTAAAGYGVPFHIDSSRPGAEYEEPRNFEPLPKTEVADFHKLMPGGHMPSYYLSSSRLSGPTSLPSTPTAFVLPPGVATTDITGGVDSALFTAYHEDLSQAVDQAKLTANAGDEPTHRANRIRYQALRESLSFHWLALHHKDGATYAEGELERLVSVKYPDAIPAAGGLKTAGVPATTADGASPIQRIDLARLVLEVTARGNLADVRQSLPYLAVSRHARATPPIDALATLNAIRTKKGWPPI